MIDDYTPELSLEDACVDAVEWMDKISCSFAYRLAKADYENAEEGSEDVETGLAQVLAEQKWVVDYTPGLSLADACTDAVEWMDKISCSFAYRLAKADYENGEEDSEDS